MLFIAFAKLCVRSSAVLDDFKLDPVTYLFTYLQPRKCLLSIQ